MPSTMKTRETASLVALILAVPAMGWAETGSVDPLVDTTVREVQFEQRLQAQLPLDLAFRNSMGHAVVLRDLVGRGRPVVLSLVYFECPMMCTLVLNGMVKGLKDIPYTAGREFDMITLSFDHEETHVLAADKKKAYVDAYSRAGADEGWHFLVGEEEPIRQVCETVGFGFKYNPETDQYAHRSGIIILTPEGVVSRMIPGTEYDAKTLRLSLADASNGKIGNLIDRIALLCYQYDPAIGKYSLAIMNVIRLGCFLTIAALGGMLFAHFRAERRQSVLLKERKTMPAG